MASTALTIRDAGQLAVEVFGDDYQAIKNGIAPGLTDAEYDYLAAVERRTGLSLLGRQFYGIKRSVWNRQTEQYEEALGVQTAIDGYRLLAERTGRYGGQVGPYWCGEDGVWKDVWLSKDPPAAAKVAVVRTDFPEPLWAVAVWDSYVQTNRKGEPVSLWKKMPDVMLAKCAESLAIRKAFPRETSGIYTTEEMGQADNPSPAREAEPTPIRATLAPAPPAPPPSNSHQHAQLRALAENGYPLSRALGGLGLESIEDLDVEQAKNLIVQGRAHVRALAAEQVNASDPPATGTVIDTPFQLSAQQISLFWTVGSGEGWTKEAKRDALAQLFPRRADAQGTVSIKSLSRQEFDNMIALFEDRMELAYDKDGAAYLRPSGPPARDEGDTES